MVSRLVHSIGANYSASNGGLPVHLLHHIDGHHIDGHYVGCILDVSVMAATPATYRRAGLTPVHMTLPGYGWNSPGLTDISPARISP
jgi:hypothetical protein